MRINLENAVRHDACRKRGDSLQPVVVEVEQDHLRLCGFHDEIRELLCSPPFYSEYVGEAFERQREFRAFDDDVGEVQ